MNIDKVFGNKYNPDKLRDVNGDELHDCDIVETICGNCVITAECDGLYLNDAILLDEEAIRAYSIVRKKPTMNKFAVRLDCPSPCKICGNYDNCVCRQRSIKSRFAVIDEHCSMYMEYYLMKLKHNGEIGEK